MEGSFTLTEKCTSKCCKDQYYLILGQQVPGTEVLVDDIKLNMHSRRLVQWCDHRGLPSVMFNPELLLLEAIRQVLYRPLRNLCGERLPTYGVTSYWLSSRNLSKVPSVVVPYDSIVHDVHGCGEGWGGGTGQSAHAGQERRQTNRQLIETQHITLVSYPDNSLSDGLEIGDSITIVVQNQSSRNDKWNTQFIEAQVTNDAWSNSKLSYNNSGGVGIPIDKFDSKGEPLAEHEQLSRLMPSSSPNGHLYSPHSISGSGQPTDDVPLGRGAHHYTGTQDFPFMPVMHVLNGGIVHSRIADAIRSYARNRRCNRGGSSRHIMAALKLLDYSIVPGLGDRSFDTSSIHRQQR